MVKQLSLSYLFNPNIGQQVFSNPIVSNLILSGRRCLLLGHELSYFTYYNSGGQPLFELAYVGFFIVRSPSSFLNDSKQYNIGPNTVQNADHESTFVYNNTMAEGYKPINILIESNNLLEIYCTVRFSNPPVSGSNTLNLGYRLFWEEVE
jgi:hypothetical protein